MRAAKDVRCAVMQGVHGREQGRRAVLPARLRLHGPDMVSHRRRRQRQVWVAPSSACFGDVRHRDLSLAMHVNINPIHLPWHLSRMTGGRYRLVAMDMRGHGETVTRNSNDLSSGTLAQVRLVTCCGRGSATPDPD